VPTTEYFIVHAHAAQYLLVSPLLLSHAASYVLLPQRLDQPRISPASIARNSPADKTIGSEVTKIKTKSAKSAIDRKEKVIRIEY
jgi:hypothetical protein